MLRNYLKSAVRLLRRRTGYAFINAVGFTLGLVCCVLVLLFLRYEWQYDRFYENSEDVHRVLRDKRGNWWSTIPFPRYENATPTEQRRLPRALTAQIPEIEVATNFYVGPHGNEVPAYVERGDRRFTEDGLLYTTTGTSFFEVFPFDFRRGTPAEALREPGTAVLTESAAQRYFGHLDVVGEVFTVRNGSERWDVEVTGVIADVPPHSHFDFEVALHVDRIQNWGAFTYFRVAPGTDTAGLAPRIESLMNEVRPARVEDPGLRSVLGGVRIQALPDIHLGPRMLYDPKPHRDPRYLWAFAAIGILILLIVVINYTNLAVALATERRREIGVRKAMGAGQGRVAAQFLLEAIVLTLLCIPLVIAGVKGTIPVFNQVMGTHLQNEILQSPGLLAGLVGLAVLVGGAAGSYPALLLSRKNTVSLFRSPPTGGTSHRWSMRHVLIGLQFTLLIGLGSVTWLVNSQLHFLQSKDLGFQTQGIVEIDVDSANTYRRLHDRLQNVPAVQAVGAGIAPGPGRFEVTYRASDSKQIHSNGDLLNVTPGWFQALGINHPVVTEMLESGEQSPPRFLVNRAAVRALGYDQPVDRSVVVSPGQTSAERLTIDGVVNNFHFRPLYQRVQPTFLQVHPRVEDMNPLNVRTALVRLDPTALETGLDQLETAWETVRPDVPLSLQFVDQNLAQLYEDERRISRLGMGLTTIALLLAALGLVGLSAYVVRRRTQEIGVRKALGATTANIVFRLNREFLVLVGVALVVAAPVAYWLTQQWLDSFAYRIDVSPLVFLGAGASAILVSLSAAGYQAWSAARLDPADALRNE